MSGYEEQWQLHDPGARRRAFLARAARVVSSLLTAFVLLVVVPNHRAWRRPSDGFFACRWQLQNVGTALAMYADEHAGHLPSDLNALVRENYLKQLPTCPGQLGATYGYQRTARESVVFCAGSCHQATLERLHPGEPTHNLPRWSTRRGLQP